VKELTWYMGFWLHMILDDIIGMFPISPSLISSSDSAEWSLLNPVRMPHNPLEPLALTGSYLSSRYLPPTISPSSDRAGMEILTQIALVSDFIRGSALIDVVEADGNIAEMRGVAS